MSTEVNLDKLYDNSIKILSDLISFRTISGEDNSDLINYCEEYLNKLAIKEDISDKISIKTRQYAKRQMTWARGNMVGWKKINPNRLNNFLKKI